MSDETITFSQQISTLMAQVFALVQACPQGRVTTYSWIGKALGYPRGARMIGFLMHEATSAVPAQRVISSKGELTGSRAFGQIGKMRQLLETDGVTFTDDGHVDLKRYGWDPTRDLTEQERQHILTEATIPVTVSARLLHLLQTDPASPFRRTTTDA